MVIPEHSEKRGSTSKPALKPRHENARINHSMLMMEPPTIPTTPAATGDFHSPDDDEPLLDIQVDQSSLLLMSGMSSSLAFGVSLLYICLARVSC